MRNVCGIDPGQDGALAVLGLGKLYPDVHVMPMAGKEIDAGKLAFWMTELDVSHAVVEKVHSMPKQGVSSSFKFGQNYGTILGVLGALRISTELVTPQRWKKTILADGAHDKAGAIAFCRRMYPTCLLLATDRSRMPHDGMADALCLATYGMRFHVEAS